jgi:hypothetical protein
MAWQASAGGLGMEEDEVPLEDSQLTWNGSQATIMAELAHQRVLAAAASAAAAEAGGPGKSSDSSTVNSRSALLAQQHRAEGVSGRAALSRAPRPHAASVIQARAPAAPRSAPRVRAASARLSPPAAAPRPRRRSTTARWPAS